jgi:hypothetical protein
MAKQGNKYDVQFIKETGHSKWQDKEYLSKRKDKEMHYTTITMQYTLSKRKAMTK